MNTLNVGGTDKQVVLSPEDIEFFRGWTLVRGGKDGKYVAGYPKGKSTEGRFYLHRVIWKRMTGVDPLDQIDHIDRNPFNNSRDNLRSANNSRNNANSQKRRGKSKFKGVSWHSHLGKWRATCGNSHLGYFTTEEEAARAYDVAAKEAYDEYAVYNF